MSFCYQCSFLSLADVLIEAEFTQHQRDVFCVFSGTMVSKFRDYLNTAPQFESIRDSFFSRHATRLRATVIRRSSGLPAIQTTEGEAFDDDMAFDDNDFEGLDASEMAVDAQAQNLPFHVQVPPAPTQPGNQGPPPPPPPPLEPPILNSSTNFLSSMLNQPFQPGSNASAEGFDASSIVVRSFPQYAVPLSTATIAEAHAQGFPHASVAGLSQPSVARQGSSAAAGPSTGASTVTIHQPPSTTPDQQQSDTN